jgi:hypothetical protein
MNSIKAQPDACAFSPHLKNCGANSPDQNHEINNFMGLFKPLIQVSNIALKISAKCKPSAVALTKCFSALVFLSIPFAAARNLPRDKNNKGDDYKTIGQELHQAALQWRDENIIHHQKKSDEKLRIKNMHQAVTAAVYYASALTSPAHHSEKLGHRENNRAADDAHSTALSSPVLATRTQRSIEQLPQLDPTEYYMISGYGDNADRLVPLEKSGKNTHHNFLRYRDDPDVLTSGFPQQAAFPLDTPRDASLTARPGRRGLSGKRLAAPGKDKTQNILTKIKKADIRNVSLLPPSKNDPRLQAAIIQQCKATLSEDEYGIAVDNLNPAHYGQGKVYEVYNGRDGISQPVYRFYVLINADGISVRPIVMPEHGVKYEIFDSGNQAVSYPLAFSNGQWILQQPTALQVSKSLIRRITTAMADPNIVESVLSAPDERGLQWSHDHKSYLRIKGHYVELIRNKNKSNRYHIVTKHKRNRIDIKFHNDKFIVTSQRSGAKKNIAAAKREILVY